MSESCCDCGQPSQIHLMSREPGAGEALCANCFNARIAEMFEIDFEHPDFAGFSLSDLDGVERRFEVTTRLLGDRFTIEAEEVGPIDPGLRAAVCVELGTDPMEAFGVVYGRLQRLVGRRHLQIGGLGRLGVVDMTVRGQFTWDGESQGRRPAVVVDGRKLTWAQLRDALGAFEGFQFRLELIDPFNDVDA